MSTRAYIRISKEGNDVVHFNHHCDGYPSGVGSDLVNLLKHYAGEWSPIELGAYINNEDDYFKFIDNGPSWDHEYLYLIDCNKRELSCYYKGITSRSENQEDYFDSDKLFIEGNIFDGREIKSSPVAIEPDWDTFRREAAKDILCAMLGRVERFYTGVSIDGKNKIFDHKDFIKLAIGDADELIKQLKEGRA